MTKNKYICIVIWSLVTVNVLIVAYFLYLALWPFQVLTVKAPDKILNHDHQVQAGSILLYQVEYCKLTDKETSLSRSLIAADGTVFVLPPSKSNFPSGCHLSINRTTIIPEGIPAGSYRLGLTASYQVNPLRVISVRHESEIFQITSK